MAENKVIEKCMGAASAYAYAVDHGYTGTEEEFAKEQANFATNAKKVAEERAEVEKLKTDTQTIKDAAVKDVGDAKNAALTSIGNTARERLTAIQTAGSAQVEAVQDAGALEVADVENAGKAERAALGTAAEEKTAEVEERIEAKGAAVLATIPEEYTETYTRALRNESRISRNEKRLDNIEKGIMPEKYMEDNTVAYKKSVPVDAGPFVAINKVGGMTRKTANLIPYPYYENSTHTIDGITWVDNPDGSVTANGTATANSILRISDYKTQVKAGTYTFSGVPSKGSASTFMIQTGDRNGFAANNTNATGDTFTLASDTSLLFQLVVFKGYTANNLVFKPMLNSGSEALPYEPYFEGLRSAPVTEVESVGANLFDQDTWCVQNGLSPKGDGSYKGSSINKTCFTNTFGKKGSVFISYEGKTDSTVPPLLFYTIYTDGTIGYNGILRQSSSFTKISSVTPAEKTVDNIKWAYQEPGEYYVKNVRISFADGEYTPYTRNTLPIPEAVRALDGYGWGVNDTVYNYIDWEKKQFVKRVSRVDLGTLEWSMTEAGKFYATIPITTTQWGTNHLCDRYETSAQDAYNGEGNKVISLSKTRAWVLDKSYTDTATFKAAMSGVMLYYELETTVITDISDILHDDNYIPVEGGGTVTMLNEYTYAVPSEITYALKEAE